MTVGYAVFVGEVDLSVGDDGGGAEDAGQALLPDGLAGFGVDGAGDAALGRHEEQAVRRRSPTRRRGRRWRRASARAVGLVDADGEVGGAVVAAAGIDDAVVMDGHGYGDAVGFAGGPEQRAGLRVERFEGDVGVDDEQVALLGVGTTNGVV